MRRLPAFGVLFVEGQDAKILRRFAKRLGLANLSLEQKSPIFQLGGFSQWRRAESAIWAFKNLLDIEVDTICLFDKDYRSLEEITDFVEYMKVSGLQCVVFFRKEIENYLICPASIARAVAGRLERAGKDSAIATPEAFKALVEEISSDLKNSVSAHITSNVLRFARERKSPEDDATIISRALADFEAEWSNFEGMRRLAPGKELLRKLFERIQNDFSVSISVPQIQEQMRASEMDEELRNILGQLDAFFAE